MKIIILAISAVLTFCAVAAAKDKPLNKPVDVRRVGSLPGHPEAHVMRRITQTDDVRRVDFYILRQTGLVRGARKVVPDLMATIKYLGTTEEPGKVFAIRVKKLD